MRFRTGVFLLSFVLVVYWLVSWISSLPKTSAEYHDEFMSITIADGEEIFWGKGRCHLCHRIGERGYALRGPNLGESRDGKIIGARAHDRAQQLRLASGAEYLIQSLIDPGAFVVPNYKNEMPKIYEPPIALSPVEIKAVALYLQSLGGTPQSHKIKLPEIAYGAQDKSNDFAKMKFQGDAAAGRSLFFDAATGSACSSCHIGLNENGNPEGGRLGPDLTAIAAYRTLEHIYWKIIRPDSNVVSGYEEALIKTTSGQIYIGRIADETAETIILIEKNDNKIHIPKEKIAARTVQPTSMMPGNYKDLFSDEQLRDLLAYLLTLQGP